MARRPEVAEPAPAIPADEERMFEEPAQPIPEAVVPVEEPTKPHRREDHPEVCGEPNEPDEDASDLH